MKIVLRARNRAACGGWGVWVWIAPALLVLDCSEASAIKSSANVKPNDVAAVVLITARNSKTLKVGRCCGLMIGIKPGTRNSRFVLTAAHCVASFDTWDVTIPHTINGPVQAQVSSASIYPPFKEHAPNTFEDDVALLILRDAIAFQGPLPTVHAGNPLPLQTHLVVMGRVHNGVISDTHSFRALTTQVAFPGNINVYGGNPQITEAGDSGGPVFVAGKANEVVAVVNGSIRWSRFQVPTDLYVPLTRDHKLWMMQQFFKKIDEAR